MSSVTAEKIDLHRIHKDEYVAPANPVILDLGKAQYLAIDGRGSPDAPAFQSAVEALYNVAFTIKMASKREGRDYGVAKLEAQWWLDSGHDFMQAPKETWNWRALIRTPDFIGARDLKTAGQQLAIKGKSAPVGDVRLLSLKEGRCVQMLHTGSYSLEFESICRMLDHATAQGYQFHGLHHEIYLSDPRRVAGEKLRTILRMPVRK